ncbi:hypothetical protein IWW50_005108 [Coemansia erecta]|nr:hypothetical protein IWW50_005108 [Coemansia erecta]
MNSEDNDTPASSRAPPPPSAPAPAAEKSPDAPRFSLSFLRKNHNRSSSHGAPESAPPAPPAPPTTQAPLRPPVVPGRRADSGAPPLPPTSAPSRPGSSISTKRAPPVPPASKKPTIKPKPAGLSSSRLSSINSSPNPAMNSSPNLRSQLRPTSVSPRNSAEGQDPYGGIISESQGSVSSLRGMFGKSVRNRPAVQSHAPVESSFAEPPRAPAKAPPPLPPSIADNSAYSHRRTSSNSPGQPLPPPPAPAALPSRPAAANGSSGVPVREGKWTFHTMSELPPPPPSSTIPQHVYPSRNYTGSTINIDI